MQLIRKLSRCSSHFSYEFGFVKFPLPNRDSHFSVSEGLAQGFKFRAIGVCCWLLPLASFSRLTFGKNSVYIILSLFSKRAHLIKDFLPYSISVINFIHTWLHVTPTGDFCDCYSKREGFPPTSLYLLLRLLTTVGGPLTHVINMSREGNYSVFRRKINEIPFFKVWNDSRIIICVCVCDWPFCDRNSSFAIVLDVFWRQK